MSQSEPHRATQLRERFKQTPQSDRDKYQAFSIRVWRGVSWLERAENAPDLEGRFISLWIAFNAIYGRGDDGCMRAGDRGSWQSFLARKILERDANDILGRLVRQNQELICRLIECQYLFRPFWQKKDNWEDTLRRSVKRIRNAFDDGHVLPIVQELFERLYILRVQVFHGAATSGSKLNRETLEVGTQLLSFIIPAMLEIMLDVGPRAKWGDVCFPPMD